MGIRPATPSGPVVPVSGIVSGGCYIYNIANYNSSNGLDMQIDPTTNRIGVALSSRRFKENEALLDETEVRTKIAAMQPKSFNIIGQPGPDYGSSPRRWSTSTPASSSNSPMRTVTWCP